MASSHTAQVNDLEALKAATREAHAAIKDLRAAMREAKLVIDEANAAAQTAVEEKVHEALRVELEKISEAVKLAVEDASERVYKRFDTITNILLGEDKTARRRHEASLSEVVQAAKDEGRL